MSNYSAASATYPHSEKSEDSDEEDGDHPRVVDTDPTGRFERFEESLGVGAYKEVFKAFDQEEGVEVAWCQLRVNFSKKKDAEKIQREIEILQSLRCEYVINFYSSWVKKGNDGKEHVFFVTELMTSGTLKQYIRKTKGQLKPKVLKTWARHILKGLHYLHTREPPVIHRDLKCDNIFINGNNGQAKIGDLGLAIIKNKDHASSVLGTPEFMAPELYEEKYNEKVDIYAFGMCILELVTKEYPYQECTNPAQIYRKVSTGVKPQALQKVKDHATLEFIELCLKFDPDERPSAAELLKHEFLKEVSDQNGVRERVASPRPHTPSPPKSPVLQISQPAVISNGNNVKTPTSVSISNPGTDLRITVDETKVHNSGHKHDFLPSVPQVTTTTKTIDAEIKTYQVRSAHVLPSNNAGNASQYPPAQQNRTEEAKEPSIQCKIKIVKPAEKEKQLENEVTFMMTIVNTGPQDVEIKFPFNLLKDTPEDVVAEMVKEQILAQEGQDLARQKIQDMVNTINSSKHLIEIHGDLVGHSSPSSKAGSTQGESEGEQDGGSHGTDDEKLQRAKQAIHSVTSSHSDTSSSYGSMDTMQHTHHQDLESFAKTSSALSSWEREDNEVRQVLHNSKLSVNSADELVIAPQSLVDQQSMPTPECVGTPPPISVIVATPLTANSPSTPIRNSSHSRETSSETANNKGIPSSPSAFNRAGTTIPSRGSALPIIQNGNVKASIHGEDDKNRPALQSPQHSRPSSVASQASVVNPNNHMTSRPAQDSLFIGETVDHAFNVQNQPNNVAFNHESPSENPSNSESPRVHVMRSVSFSNSHSSGVPSVQLQRQRRLSNPVLSSSPTQGFIAEPAHFENSQRVRRASVSSNGSHSSGHSDSQTMQQTNLFQSRLYLQSQPPHYGDYDDVAFNPDVGAGLGIQAEREYTSKYRHGMSTSSVTSHLSIGSSAVLPGITSSTDVSPSDQYPQVSVSESHDFLSQPAPVIEHDLLHQYQPQPYVTFEGSNYEPAYVEEPSLYETGGDNTSDDELVTLRRKQDQETAELLKKHAQEWVQLISDRKMKYKQHSLKSHTPKSPVINRPITDFANQVNSLPPSTTSSVGLQTNANDNIDGILRTNIIPQMTNTTPLVIKGPLQSSSILPFTKNIRTSSSSSSLSSSSTTSTASNSAVMLPTSATSQLSSTNPIITSMNPVLATINTSSSNKLISMSSNSTTIPSSSLVKNGMPVLSPTSVPSSFTPTSAPNTTFSSSTSSTAAVSAQLETGQPQNTIGMQPTRVTKPLPDQLIAAMTERQITELQNLTNPKQGTAVNGTAGISNLKTQGRESPGITLSRKNSQSQLQTQYQSNASLSLNEMEKQRQACLMAQTVGNDTPSAVCKGDSVSSTNQSPSAFGVSLYPSHSGKR